MWLIFSGIIRAATLEYGPCASWRSVGIPRSRRAGRPDFLYQSGAPALSALSPTPNHCFSQCLLSRSAALTSNAAAFDHSSSRNANIEIWFADVLWLTPAGLYAVAGRGSSLVYPYKLHRLFVFSFPCFETLGNFSQCLLSRSVALTLLLRLSITQRSRK